jgi:hypothetical protein
MPLHPNAAQLMAFHDAELGETERQEIECHLNHCQGCQSEIRQLQADFEGYLLIEREIEILDSLVLQQGLERLKEALQDSIVRLSLDVEAGRFRAESQRWQLSCEIEALLGTRAASVWRDATEGIDDPQRMIDAAVPRLAGVLGKKAMSRLEAQLSKIAAVDVVISSAVQAGKKPKAKSAKPTSVF